MPQLLCAVILDDDDHDFESNRPPDGEPSDADRLLQFNRDLLDQALSLVAAHELAGPPQGPIPECAARRNTSERADAPAFGAYAGAHLRHVIEHYEALVLRPLSGVTVGAIDYDNRPRDRELERCPQRARARLQRLQQRLRGWSEASLEVPVGVLNRCGIDGEFELQTRSSVGRELMFLASHAVHHFALLKEYCEQHGIATGSRFGQAPATVRNALNA